MEKPKHLGPVPSGSGVVHRSSENMFPLIVSQQSSGLTQRQFCEEQGIAPHIFSYWLRKYRESHNLDTGFLPLRVSEGKVSTLIRLELSSGHRLELSDQVSASWVAALLGELG